LGSGAGIAHRRDSSAAADNGEHPEVRDDATPESPQQFERIPDRRGAGIGAAIFLRAPTA
jgi:hypothetical protein